MPLHENPAIRFVARAVATAGGAGYSPVAPGTCGTIVAVPLCWALRDTSLPVFAAVCALVTAVGIWAAAVADASWGTHDSGRICIDEVAGYLVTMALVPRGEWRSLLAGFVIFRVLDIVKPPPVRQVDARLGGGAGVVLDDVLAGVYGAALMWGLHRFHAV